jgi:hypothetical protein
MPVIGGDVQKIVRGVLDCLHDLRVGVPGADDADAAHEIEVAVAVHVPDLRPAALRHDERIVARVGRRGDRAVARDERRGAGPRQWHANVD